MVRRRHSSTDKQPPAEEFSHFRNHFHPGHPLQHSNIKMRRTAKCKSHNSIQQPAARRYPCPPPSPLHITRNLQPQLPFPLSSSLFLDAAFHFPCHLHAHPHAHPHLKSVSSSRFDIICPLSSPLQPQVCQFSYFDGRGV